jgi:LemA protein
LVVGVIIAIFVVMGLGGYFVIIYNGLIKLRNNINKSWANIDVLLKQRHDELPKLIDVCKGYMKYEQETFKLITEARAFYNKAKTVGEKARADLMEAGALKNLFAVAERYPDLKANENFKHLQSRVSGLENEIADRRELYNDSANNFNIRIQSIPDVLVARMLRYAPKEMFKVSEANKEDVKIAF